MVQFQWRPRLEGGDAPLYEQVVEALARDVRAGVLAGGTRIPPQRELATILGLALGTVTRALGEARRRGLITAQVGRGSFIATRDEGGAEGWPAGTPRPLDLARNLPPLRPLAEHVADGVATLSYHATAALLGEYAPPAGLARHRELMAGWIRRTSALDHVDGSRVLLCNGATQGMSLAFEAVCRRGDAIVCDAATYSGMKVLADHAGYRLVGVALDGEGMIPRAFDKALRASSARAWYALPTLQNPTARTMSPRRRRALLEIAAKRDVWIIEDDVYGPLGHDAGIVQLAAMAPERTFYVGSMKMLFPGLRAGFVVPPLGAAAEKVAAGLLAQTRAGESVTRTIVAHWLERGTCDAIAAEVIAEARWRTQRACEILAGHVERPSLGASLHLWLPMAAMTAERLTAAALRANLELTPPTAPIVDPAAASGIRICLGAAPDRATLERGLSCLRDLIAAGGDVTSHVV